MKITYNLTGPERKKLVQAISEIRECDPKYLGVPTCAYQVDYITIDKNGTLSFDDCADSGEIEQLIEALLERGFEAEVETEETALEIQMPKSSLDSVALDNLNRLIEAKGTLIKKALGIEALPITEKDDRICFPWFTGESTPDEVKAYTHFISALCKMAREAKRVTAKEKETENEKYAFRCFLLRLGFIGDAYKDERKILLRNLTGSSAFKSGAKKKYEPGCDPIPTPENTVPFDVEEAKERLQNPDVQEEIKDILNGGDAE